METLYSSWNPGDQYHLTTLSGPSSTDHLNTSSISIGANMTPTGYLAECDTPPTPVTNISVIFNNNNNNSANVFYSPSSQGEHSTLTNNNNNNNTYTEITNDLHFDYQQTMLDVNNYSQILSTDNYSNVNGQSSFLSQNNYTIPTSMESPANTSYSSPSPSPDLWESYALTENGKQQQSHYHHHNHHNHHHQHKQQQPQCNLEQSNLQQPHTHHNLHHQQQNHPQNSPTPNYHNQQHQVDHNHQQHVQHGNIKSNGNHVTNDGQIGNNQSSTINNNINTKNTINPSTKSINHRGSYKLKKSQSDTNSIKNEPSSHNHQMNENFLHHRHHHHHHHHRSIERRGEGGGGGDKYLCPEDEERRRRRRERNKVAATKCRNKKKVHVIKLCQESQTLELTNSSLKEEMQNLRREEQRLNDLLVKHLPFCVRRTLQPISDSINL